MVWDIYSTFKNNGHTSFLPSSRVEAHLTVFFHQVKGLYTEGSQKFTHEEAYIKLNVFTRPSRTTNYVQQLGVGPVRRMGCMATVA
jgi:hypothetical protein